MCVKEFWINEPLVCAPPELSKGLGEAGQAELSLSSHYRLLYYHLIVLLFSN